MNKITYYCPQCKTQQTYISNPYCIHICTECKVTCHRDQLITQVVNIDQLIEDFQSCYDRMSEESFNRIMQILKTTKENI